MACRYWWSPYSNQGNKKFNHLVFMVYKFLKIRVLTIDSSDRIQLQAWLTVLSGEK